MSLDWQAYVTNQSQALNVIQYTKSKNESVKVMKKIFQTLAVSAAVFYMAFLPVCASCPIKLTENITGAACSVPELNKLEKGRSMKENLYSKPKSERDLRPIRVTSEMNKWNNSDCLFGTCFYKTILAR